MTPEEHYAKIDERLDPIAQHAQILSEMLVRSEEWQQHAQALLDGLAQSERQSDELMNRLANMVIRREERLDALDRW